MPLLLTDLDGTLRKSASGARFITKPFDQEIIENIPRALDNWLNEASRDNSGDTKIIGITNQGGVATGHKLLEDCLIEQAVTIKLLEGRLDRVYACIDFDGYKCFVIFDSEVGLIADNEGFLNFKTQLKYSRLDIIGKFRKPDAGMLTVARLTQNHHPAECLYIGDREEDRAAALNAKIPFLWVAEFMQKYG
jgi:D-glycero-D-manno-heptose 1,7-bisphosphate phosphatase